MSDWQTELEAALRPFDTDDRFELVVGGWGPLTQRLADPYWGCPVGWYGLDGDTEYGAAFAFVPKDASIDAEHLSSMSHVDYETSMVGRTTRRPA